MGQWFYAEGNRQQGPLTSEELTSLYTSSRIGLDTLVWRDGLPAWQPLRTVADELQLVTAPPATPAPPALPETPDTLLEGGFHLDPPAPEPTPEPTAAPPRGPATFQIDTSTRTQAPPPPRAQPQQPAGYSAAPTPSAKKSGCGPVAIVLAIIGGVLLVAIAILAAIAVPAYNDYVSRAKITNEVGKLTSLHAQVTEFVFNHDRCPVNGDEGFNAPEAYASENVAAVRIGRFGEGRCGVEIEFSAPGKRDLDGKMLWFEYDIARNHWSCTSDASERVVPMQCKG